MKSIAFPDMFTSTVTRVVKDSDATLSNLKLLLTSETGALFGDPYFGTRIRNFMYEQNNIVLRDLIVDAIYLAIATFMPQLYVTRKDIKVDGDETHVYATINCINKLDNMSNSYQIQLLSNLL